MRALKKAICLGRRVEESIPRGPCPLEEHSKPPWAYLEVFLGVTVLAAGFFFGTACKIRQTSTALLLTRAPLVIPQEEWALDVSPVAV